MDTRSEKPDIEVAATKGGSGEAVSVRRHAHRNRRRNWYCCFWSLIFKQNFLQLLGGVARRFARSQPAESARTEEESRSYNSYRSFWMTRRTMGTDSRSRPANHIGTQSWFFFELHAVGVAVPLNPPRVFLLSQDEKVYMTSLTMN